MKTYLFLLLFFSSGLFARTVISADKADKLATKLSDADKQKLREAYLAEE